MKDVIDFNRVPPEQIAIHERLVNWARWCRPSFVSSVHPMFRQAISAARAREEVGTAPPVNELDARVIQAAYAALQGRERRAIAWCYVTRGAVTGAMRQCGTDKRGLLELVNQAREKIAQGA